MSGKRKYYYWFFSCLLIFGVALSACAPCREVNLVSSPPGAQILLPAARVLFSDRFSESWTPIGRTPMKIVSCRAEGGLLARWEGLDLTLDDIPPGTRGVYFNFLEEEVSFKDASFSPTGSAP